MTTTGCLAFAVGSRENVVEDSSGHVRQSEVASRIFVRQLFVIQAQRVQQSRMQVVHVNFPGDRFVTQFVGFAIAETGPSPAARQENREPARVVVSTVAVL